MPARSGWCSVGLMLRRAAGPAPAARGRWSWCSCPWCEEAVWLPTLLLVPDPASSCPSPEAAAVDEADEEIEVEPAEPAAAVEYLLAEVGARRAT